MFGLLLQMAAMIAMGVVWRRLQPVGQDPDSTRRAITGLVYGVLLPALVLDVLWRTPMGIDTIKIVIIAATGVLVALAVAVPLYRTWGIWRPSAGAMLLAAGFGNVTYLGLPVLEASLGPWARGVAIQYDLFACTPLLLTLGVLLAGRYGNDRDGVGSPYKAVLSVPPLWAALGALGLSLGNIPQSDWLHGLLSTLGAGVVPLMLVSLGMGLRWDAFGRRAVAHMAPAITIQLLLTPLLVWGMALIMGLSGPMVTALVLEGAMPCMVLGMVICDRYGLDTPLYAAAVTLSTLLSLVTLPVWFRLLG